MDGRFDISKSIAVLEHKVWGQGEFTSVMLTMIAEFIVVFNDPDINIYIRPTFHCSLV